MNQHPVEQLFLLQDQSMIHNALARTLEPGYAFGPHCHENVEIIVMQEGVGDFVVNGILLSVHPGEMAIIFSHIIHSFQVRSKDPCRFLQIHFCPAHFLSMNHQVIHDLKFIRYMTDAHSAYLCRPYTPQILSCVERICSEVANEAAPHHNALANTYIAELVFLLSREIEDSHRQIFTIENPLAITAINYISTHLEEKLSLEDVARECHVTSRYLSQVFKDSVNITINAYITIAKIDRAATYIGDAHMSVTDVANLLGFSSPQYFSKVFKRYTGVSPSEFISLDTAHTL